MSWQTLQNFLHCTETVIVEKTELLKHVHGFTSAAAFGWYYREQVDFYFMKE
jgi:hypothetical protein